MSRALTDAEKAFLEAVVAVERDYGFSIGHEDSHGAFIVEPFNEAAAAWLLDAAPPDEVVSEEERERRLEAADRIAEKEAAIRYAVVHAKGCHLCAYGAQTDGLTYGVHEIFTHPDCVVGLRHERRLKLLGVA